MSDHAEKYVEPANVEEYVRSAVQGFVGDPPDTDSQWGYLSALLYLAKEPLGLRIDMPPFAEAHEQVGRLVRHCADRQITFAELSSAEAQQFIPAWYAKLRAVAISPEKAIRRRNVIGGTAPAQVSRQLRAAQRAVAQLKRKLARLS